MLCKRVFVVSPTPSYPTHVQLPQLDDALHAFEVAHGREEHELGDSAAAGGLCVLGEVGDRKWVEASSFWHARDPRVFLQATVRPLPSTLSLPTTTTPTLTVSP